MTPLGALWRGALAGAAGTLAMDLLWFYRYKRGGGQQSFFEWEFSVGVDDWSKASAPAQVGKRLYEGFFQRELDARYAALTQNVMHWSYGTGWAGLYGLIAGSLRRRQALSGLPFGAFVFGADYAILPLANIYKPIWLYDLRTVLQDLSAHLVYGMGTSISFRVLAKER